MILNPETLLTLRFYHNYFHVVLTITFDHLSFSFGVNRENSTMNDFLCSFENF